MPMRTPCAMAARAYFWRRIYGSKRSSLAHESIIPITMNANGSAETTMIDCSPPSASSPPASNRDVATVPSRTPQVIATKRVGFGMPLWLIEPITIDAESAEVTKKITIENIATMEVRVPRGKLFNIAKSMSSGSPEAEMFLPWDSSHIDVPPKIPNQVKHTREGTTMTTVTNSRRVRPREILAIESPTNGVQDTHPEIGSAS